MWQRKQITKDIYTFTNQNTFTLGGLTFPIKIPTQQGATITYSSQDTTTQITEVDRTSQLSTTIHVPAHVQVKRGLVYTRGYVRD
jgi:hypothetical protein